MSAILITNGLISGHVFVYVVISRAPPLLLASNHTPCKCIPRERYAKWNDFTIHRHYGSSPWTYITSRCCLFDRDKHFVPDQIYVVPLSVRWKEKTRSINFSMTKWRNELFGWWRIIVINKKTVWIFFYTYNGWSLLTFRNISIFERPRFFYSEREEHSCNNKF